MAELTAAGYEAYNVTGDNYEALEESLQTDFTSLGLDPNSSYVVVISGEAYDHGQVDSDTVASVDFYVTTQGGEILFSTDGAPLISHIRRLIPLLPNSHVE